MGLNDVTVVRGSGGLGRPLSGEDYISGLMFFTDTFPSGFAATSPSTRGKKVLSVAGAEALGILNDYSDETKAAAKIVLTNNGTGGAVGDTIEIKVQEAVNLVSLGVYTLVTATALTANLNACATAIAALINLGTPTHGYSATVATATITLTFSKGQGVFPNSGTPVLSVLSNSVTNYFSTVITQPTGSGGTVLGVASKLALWHYHIAEYFRIQPSGNLWVYFNTLTANAYDFAEILALQGLANGQIRQLGVWLGNTTKTSAANLASVCDSIQIQANALEVLHQPLSVIVGAAINTISDLTTLVDLSTHSDRSVSVTIGQDGANAGYLLWKGMALSITNVGAVLGAVSLAAVNEDIAWVQKFNLSNGLELNTPAYANGTLVNMITDNNQLVQLQNFRYIFLRYFTGLAGSYVNENPCAITPTSAYAYINDNRTIDKVDRLLYAAYLPFLNAPILLNSDGTLTDNTVAYLTSLGNTALDQMVRDQEISFRKIIIDTTQNVISTNKLIVAVQIVPDGVARNIQINTQFVTSV